MTFWPSVPDLLVSVQCRRFSITLPNKFNAVCLGVFCDETPNDLERRPNGCAVRGFGVGCLAGERHRTQAYSPEPVADAKPVRGSRLELGVRRWPSLGQPLRWL